MCVSDGTGTQYHGEMGWKQVDQDFSSFFDNFLPYLMVFKEENVEGGIEEL